MFGKDDLQWDVTEQGLYLRSGAKVPSHKAIVRTEVRPDGLTEITDKVLGIHSNRYEPVHNVEVREFADIVAKESGGTIRGSWSVADGRTVGIQIEGGSFIIPGDPSTYDDFMVIGNSHDGSLPFVAHPTQVRVECQNTFFAALRMKGGIPWTAPNGVDAQKDVLGYRIRHTASIHDKIDQAQAAIRASYAEREMFAAWAEQAQQYDLDWDRFVNVLVPDAESERESALEAVEDARRTLREVAERRTNYGLSGAWKALNAGIEYLDHFETAQRKTKTADQRKLLRTVGFSNEKAQRLTGALKAAML